MLLNNYPSTADYMEPELLVDESQKTPGAGKRIIVKKGREFHVFRFEDVAYFYIDNGLSFLVDRLRQQKYITSKPLRNIEAVMNSKYFFRANKKYLVNIHSVVKFKPEKRGKLQIFLDPDPKEPLIVSQLKANLFKEWIIQT
jgi:two-component system, LytTR family, response regulator LytT